MPYDLRIPRGCRTRTQEGVVVWHQVWDEPEMVWCGGEDGKSVGGKRREA